MGLPSHTLKQLRDELARQPSLRRRIARAWIGVGCLVAALITAMAVAHYVYGMPVHDENTGQLSTPANTLMLFLLIGGGGAVFVVMGILLHRWDPD
jgi:hypothetical protein